MKLLWAKADFLHPPDRGGQIRTLEMLRRLSKRHEIHYVALHRGDASRSGEYCFRAYPVEHFVPEKNSLAFAAQLVKGLTSPRPVVVDRYRSTAMSRQIEALCRSEKFDAVICDFLFPAPNIPDLQNCVLFQHNVEAVIWKRHAENARDPARRWYFRAQAERMAAFEAEVCRTVRGVIAVSEVDAELMRQQYRPRRVDAVATGVDVDYFRRPPAVEPGADLVFVGSMDWMPNIDGAEWFVREILPLIRRQKPDCSVVFAGRRPGRTLLALAEADPRIQVTGTVPDIRPYLWGSAVSIVPLRVGGGTRLKIFEAMAAGVPVVSTTIGAEGLPLRDGSEICLADQPREFAERCLELITEQGSRRRMSEAAEELVRSRFSWETAAGEFERLLPC